MISFNIIKEMKNEHSINTHPSILLLVSFIFSTLLIFFSGCSLTLHQAIQRSTDEKIEQMIVESENLNKTDKNGDGQ